MPGCPKHPGGNRSCLDVRCQRTWKVEGAPSAEEQLRLWADGQSVCPNADHECCPDFSCCRPSLKWPEPMRRAFVVADQRTREKMLMAGLAALCDAAAHDVPVHITGGVPEDEQ